jgi:DNA-binding response OmpR family regulator
MEDILSKAKIVMVDDEKDILESYKDFLEEKYDVSEFLSADSYLNYVSAQKSNPFDLLITDYNLHSTKSGLEMVESAFKMERQCPFILMSGFLDRDNTLIAHNIGAYRILPKPVDPQVLEIHVQNLLYENYYKKIQKENAVLNKKLREICSLFELFMNRYASEQQIEDFFMNTYGGKDLSQSLNFKDYIKSLEDESYRNTKMEEILSRQISRLSDYRK